MKILHQVTTTIVLAVLFAGSATDYEPGLLNGKQSVGEDDHRNP